MNTNERERVMSVKFDWNDIDYDIGYLRIELGLAVPECDTCKFTAYCDCDISSCLAHHVIELRVVVTGS